jgi:hypothetical protein
VFLLLSVVRIFFLKKKTERRLLILLPLCFVCQTRKKKKKKEQGKILDLSHGERDPATLANDRKTKENEITNRKRRRRRTRRIKSLEGELMSLDGMAALITFFLPSRITSSHAGVRFIISITFGLFCLSSPNFLLLLHTILSPFNRPTDRKLRIYINIKQMGSVSGVTPFCFFPLLPFQMREGFYSVPPPRPYIFWQHRIKHAHRTSRIVVKMLRLSQIVGRVHNIFGKKIFGRLRLTQNKQT